jgi:hypothetical protein
MKGALRDHSFSHGVATLRKRHAPAAIHTPGRTAFANMKARKTLRRVIVSDS